ncbi:MAG: ATP-dependent helicase, partial [Actinomycetota bacterium]
VRREAGYDGEYGSVRLFAPGELDRSAALFEVTRSPGLNGRPERLGAPGPGSSSLPGDASPPAKGGPALSGRLDPDQLAAVTSGSPLMIIAGPGTGKTLTLASRIAQQIAAGAAPGACLAITFTRRAAGELRDRLAALGTPGAAQVCVTTFHGLGLLILRDEPQRAGLTGDFQIADEATLAGLAAELAGSPRAGRRLLAEAAADPGRRAELVTALRARDLVDFDGLIELPVALLRGDLALAARLRGRWRSISVDEYQDIDAAQYELLRLLAGDGARLTAIGDPDQAIYGFRGADVGFFLRFGADYPGATQLQLSRNYRASGSIVAGALQAIAPDTLAPGRVLRAVRPGGPPITVHEAADEHAEAAWIAAVVDGLLGGSSFHSIDSGRVDGRGQDGLSLRDVAVLYRTDGQTAVLGQALTRAGLPFQKGSHDLLGRRSGVQEIIGQLRLAPAAQPAVGSAAADGPGTVARRLRAAVRGLVAGRSGAAATDIRAAGEILLPLARRCSDDLDLFLAEISLGAQADALDPRADAVTLLTLHAAKGLEFEAVFLAGCERGLLPLWLPGADRDLAEERRLLFVGMSRARSRLFLSYAARRARRGGEPGGGPSPFLADLDPALLRRPAPPRPRRPASQQLRLL